MLSHSTKLEITLYTDKNKTALLGVSSTVLKDRNYVLDVKQREIHSRTFVLQDNDTQRQENKN